jgi:cation:H+ antiporter
MWVELGWLALGIGLAAGGGDLFVRAAIELASRLRIRPAVIGLTVAAFATSAPELSVAASAALAGRPEIALGNALGANVVNLGLVAGLAFLIRPTEVKREGVSLDLPVALGASIAILGFGHDGSFGRVDAAVMLALFGGWLWALLRAERAGGHETTTLSRTPPATIALHLALGIALLVAAGETIVHGATGLATRFEWNPFVVSATLVALGTSTPELATMLASKLRGHDELGLGTILGSAIFNLAFIVPVAALVRPIGVAAGVTAIAAGFGAALLLAAMPYRRGVLGRARGAVLLGLYAASVLLLTQAG